MQIQRSTWTSSQARHRIRNQRNKLDKNMWRKSQNLEGQLMKNLKHALAVISAIALLVGCVSGDESKGGTKNLPQPPEIPPPSPSSN